MKARLHSFVYKRVKNVFEIKQRRFFVLQETTCNKYTNVILATIGKVDFKSTVSGRDDTCIKPGRNVRFRQYLSVYSDLFTSLKIASQFLITYTF